MDHSVHCRRTCTVYLRRKPHSACTDSVFTTFGWVVRHKANDGVGLIYAICARFKDDTALSGVV